MSITVGLITDIHHGLDSEYVQGSAALPLLEGALESLLSQTVAHQPELFVDLGDRINHSEPDQAELATAEVAVVFDRASLPKIHLQGNDDVMPRPGQERLLGVSLGNQSLELGGWHLIFLDTFDGSVEGALSPATLTWLERVLSENTLPTVIFSHQPLGGEPLPGNPFFDGDSSYQAHPKGHAEACRLMERSGRVKLAINGHTHWNHRVEVNGIYYLTLDALVPLLGDEAVGVYGLLTFEQNAVRLAVFGRSPWLVELHLLGET